MVPDSGNSIVNSKGWQRVAMGMMSVVFLLLGAFLGDFAASVRYASLTTKLDKHANSEGHPVMVQRVSDISKSLSRIEESIRQQGIATAEKLQRQSVVLREIEQRVAENGQ